VHIFIDESGTFAEDGKRPSIAVVGALIVPDARLARIEEKYTAIRHDLPKDKDEVKGRLLSEPEVARVVSMLKRYEVLFEVTAIDSAMHLPGDTTKHQLAQAERFTRHLTDQHHPNLRKQVGQLRRRLEEMAPQLYAQTTATFSVIETVIQHATMFYSQRIPKELGSFHWVIDGKDGAGTTDWEEWWSQVVATDLQSRSMARPLVRVREGDYSHWDRRFKCEIADYLKPHFKGGRNDAIDVGLLMTESVRFSSGAETGLELVDILTNAVRRALTGNMTVAGWGDIRSLMVQRQGQYVEIVVLRETVLPGPRPRYWTALQHFTQGGKRMFAPRFRNKGAEARESQY